MTMRPRNDKDPISFPGSDFTDPYVENENCQNSKLTTISHYFIIISNDKKSDEANGYVSTGPLL